MGYSPLTLTRLGLSTKWAVFENSQRGKAQGKHCPRSREELMAKDHGPSVKNDKQYEGLRKKGMSKERAAKIANTPDASKKGGKNSGKKKSS